MSEALFTRIASSVTFWTESFINTSILFWATLNFEVASQIRNNENVRFIFLSSAHWGHS